MPTESKPAFFSYCREDSDFALKLAADLKSAGADVWIDQLDIEPGLPWDRAVEDALNSAPRMLVLLSPVSVASENVRDEVSFALSRQKRVIPVLYRDCDIPFRLARLQHIDFRPDYGRALSILLRALGVAESAPSHPTASTASGGQIAAMPAPQPTATQHAPAEEKERETAAEQARLEEERRLAAENARLEAEDRERKEAEVQARHEQSRREQRAAEQARLEEEARQAAEKARLAEEERTRKEAELKARQEQLRREEQESIERRVDLARLEQEQREREKAQAEARAKAPGAAAVPGAAVARKQTPQPPEPQPAPPSRSSARYIGIAVAALVLVGVIIFFVTLRKPEPQPMATLPAAPAAGQTASSSAPANPAPSTDTAASTTPSSGGSSAAPSQATSTGEKPSETSSGSTPSQDSKKPQLKPLGNTAALAAKAVANPPVSVRDSSGAPTRVQLPAEVSKGFLEHEVLPTYPPLAQQAGVHGVVVLQVVIDKNGVVQGIKTVSGHPLLVPAAIDAVKQWRYRPFLINDKPVEVDTPVTVNFALAK